MKIPGAALVAAIVLAGCPEPCGKCDTAPPAKDTGPEPFGLYSEAFDDSGQIPVRFTCDGDDFSPRMYWLGSPADVASWALVMIDPDANDTPHWAIYDIPADTAWLSEAISPGGALPTGALELANYRGTVGYAGPCPPAEHSYLFTLHALSTPSLAIPTSASFDDLVQAAEAVLLEQATITGTYGG